MEVLAIIGLVVSFIVGVLFFGALITEPYVNGWNYREIIIHGLLFLVVLAIIGFGIIGFIFGFSYFLSIFDWHS